MLSQTTEYALRAMVLLAGAGNRPVTTEQIAAGARVPIDYLSKVLQQLSRAGLVVAQRGKGGGFSLSRAAQSISVLQVVNAVDPVRRIRACPLQLAEHGHALCPLHRKLDEAMRHMEEAFANTGLAELVEAPEAAAHA